MGLFDKLKKAVLKTEDEVLLTEALIAVSFADGDDQWEESELIKAYLRTLPELKDKDVYEIYEKAEKNVKLHGALSRVKELGKLGTPALKHKCFLLSLDLALSSGDIDDGEEAVLAAMQETLGINDADAQRYADVLQVKYTT
ncbi:MAG TPA: TerB family tellurite resistance protein [Kofleriaceae bacterium]|jgi:tellurite resistance protein|nr:TerB family tellurite resistance protein [Kofleriaceae bacterium]